MPDWHSPDRNARQPFATAPYRPAASDRLAPSVLPGVCLLAEAGDDPCRIGVDHYRPRKTGPAFPVAVLKCSTHRRCFTLYPLGHYPYGRAAAAPVASDGEPLYSDSDGGERSLAWGFTLFATIFALAAGQKLGPADRGAWWAREPPDRVSFAAAVLGLGIQLAEGLVQAIAQALGIAGLVLRQARRDYQAARGPAARAALVVTLLSQLPPDRRLVDCLLGSGALAGCWGTVAHWDPGPRGPRRRLFPGRGIPDG